MKIPLLAIQLQDGIEYWKNNISPVELQQARDIFWSGHYNRYNAAKTIKDLYADTGNASMMALSKASAAVKIIEEEERQIALDLINEGCHCGEVIDFLKEMYQEHGMPPKKALERARTIYAEVLPGTLA